MCNHLLEFCLYIVPVLLSVHSEYCALKFVKSPSGFHAFVCIFTVWRTFNKIGENTLDSMAHVEAFLVIFKFEKCDFILMLLTN